MKTLNRFGLIRFCTDEGGATAIEYGLIAALISVASIGGMNVLGAQLTATFQSFNTALAR